MDNLKKDKSHPLRFDVQEILRYLGYRGEGEPPADILRQIEYGKGQLIKIARPMGICKVFSCNGIDEKNLLEKNIDEGVLLSGTSVVLRGKDIAQLLQSCESAILLAVTLGGGVDQLIRKMQITDMSSAVVIDSCASSAVEQLCNNYQKGVEEEFEENGLFFTDRFSPGYGDMPLEQQRELCDLLDTRRRIGLTVTSNSILVPSKSITAIIGIAKEPQRKYISGCESCKLNHSCAFRKNGSFCGGTENR